MSTHMTKKELIRLLEPYSDETVIYMGVNLLQGYVGFCDLKHDKKSKHDGFLLVSKALDDWYRDDIKELMKED